MQTVLLALACVVLAVWGAGSVVQAWTHAAHGWLGFAPRAAALLIFMGMLIGPARSHSAANVREPREQEG